MAHRAKNLRKICEIFLDTIIHCTILITSGRNISSIEDHGNRWLCLAIPSYPLVYSSYFNLQLGISFTFAILSTLYGTSPLAVDSIAIDAQVVHPWVRSLKSENMQICF